MCDHSLHQVASRPAKVGDKRAPRVSVAAVLGKHREQVV